jgi:hypothetical protein
MASELLKAVLEAEERAAAIQEDARAKAEELLRLAKEEAEERVALLREELALRERTALAEENAAGEEYTAKKMAQARLDAELLLKQCRSRRQDAEAAVRAAVLG